MFHTLLSKSVIQFDGAMGTELQRKSENLEGCVEILNITQPDIVTSIHADYAASGAQAVTTNTLGANRVKLEKYNLSDKTAEINAAAINCAKNSGATLVALSVGPTGEFLEPLGTLSVNDLYTVYAEQALSGEAAGADIILIETQTDISQAKVAALAAKEKTSLPVIVSMTFEQNGKTMMGQPPECAVLSLAPFIDAIGINCSGGPEQMLVPLAKMRQVSPLPVIVQPNAGMPSRVGEATVFPYGAADMAPLMARIVEEGAAGIGGCCGTTPGHIALMANISKKSPPPVSSWDGVKRLCSTREFPSFDEAVVKIYELNHSSVSDLLDAMYDIPDDASAVLLKLDGFSPNEIAVFLPETGITKLPLMFSSRNDERIDAALRNYHGIAAVDAPGGSCADLLKKYGAFAL